MLSNRRLRRRLKPRIEGLESRQLLESSGLGDALTGGREVAFLPEVPRHDALIHATEARVRHGVDGSGLTAAIIDTGVDFDHPSLSIGGGWRVGIDFVGHGFEVIPDAEALRHGTAVAGLLAAADPNRPGVAPGANLIGLRVFDHQGQGDFDAIGNALQWVIDHHETFHVTVVNVSIVDGRNYRPTQLPSGEAVDRIGALVRQLRDLRIPVVAASGNRFDGRQGMGFLAILEETVSVTATDVADRPLSSAQRLGQAVGGPLATDLAAPGSGLLAPAGAFGHSAVEGTSFAAPLVSGAILLLQELYKSRFGILPPVDELVGWLRDGAEPVPDPATGIFLNRLNIARSALLLPDPFLVAEPPPAITLPALPTPKRVITPPVLGSRLQARAAALRALRGPAPVARNLPTRPALPFSQDRPAPIPVSPVARWQALRATRPRPISPGA
ncbi:hypothetical protein BH23PLA1_BH23PLA1_09550 [soil metagenome]